MSSLEMHGNDCDNSSHTCNYSCDTCSSLIFAHSRLQISDNLSAANEFEQYVSHHDIEPQGRSRPRRRRSAAQHWCSSWSPGCPQDQPRSQGHHQDVRRYDHIMFEGVYFCECGVMKIHAYVKNHFAVNGCENKGFKCV